MVVMNIVNRIFLNRIPNMGLQISTTAFRATKAEVSMKVESMKVESMGRENMKVERGMVMIS